MRNFLCTLLLVGAVHADPMEAAWRSYGEGRFLEAAELASGANTSDGYVLASECVERQGTYNADKADRRVLYERAVQLGQQAIGLDAANARAHLQTAQAVGLYANTLGAMKAVRYAGKVREGMEKALELNANLAEALYSLGAWHASVGGAGGMIARVTFGATAKKAIAYFDQALELAPDLKEAHYEYAKGLLAINPRRYRERARALLNAAIALPPKDAVDRFVHDKAVKRLAKLDG